MTLRDQTPGDAELLSALMDGELTDAEQAQMLERLRTEPALQQRWARYHAARAAIATGAVRLAPGFTERVAAARDREPVVLAPGTAGRSRRRWLRPVAGVAIAASVALVAFGALSVLRDRGGEPAAVNVADSGSDRIGTGGEPGGPGVTPVVVSAAPDMTALQRAQLRQRLMLYLASHSEYADAGGVPTVIQYGRLSGLNAGQ